MSVNGGNEDSNNGFDEDDGMDDIFGDSVDLLANEKENPSEPFLPNSLPPDENSGDGDENEISISKIKAAVGFIDDEYVGVSRATQGKSNNKSSDIGSDDEDDIASVHSIKSSKSITSTRAINPFSHQQPPFQPSSTPVNLDHRFMVWNNVGIIRSYSGDEDDAIDIEFHDSSFHPPIHLRNQFDYTLASISMDAAVFACRKGKGHPSKLFSLNYGSWDASKEWTIDMNGGEEVTGVCIGISWIAASTTLNRLRLFSLGGVQLFMYDLPGQIIAISAHENLLFVTFHYGLGIGGSQSISYSIFKVKEQKLRPLVHSSPLPLSSASTLSWLGFTDEGTPVFSDSNETLRILHGQLWIPFCDMREHLNGLHDHFWVLGLSETAQNIRVIKCKGAKYPPTLPRPLLLLLEAKIPVCGYNTEKGQMEDVMLRSLLLKSISAKMDKKGFDTEECKETAERQLKETLMKLCVLSCKGNRELRASEYISLMPSSHSVQVAVKYASKIRKNALTERLIAIGRKKLDYVDSEDDDDFESTKPPVFINRSYQNTSTISDDSFSFNNSSRELEKSSNLSLTKDEEKLVKAVRNKIQILDENPLLKEQKEEIRKLSSPAVAHVPFRKERVSKEEQVQKEAKEREKLMAHWKPPQAHELMQFSNKALLNMNPELKAKAQKKKITKEKKSDAPPPPKKAQNTLFNMKFKKGKEKETNSESTSPNLVLEESNSESLLGQPSPKTPIESESSNMEDIEESESILDVPKIPDFSTFDNEADELLENESKKRKRGDGETVDDDDADLENDKNKPKNFRSKLSAFKKTIEPIS